MQLSGIRHADLLAHIKHRAGRAFWSRADADMLTEQHLSALLGEKF
jgi:hypothetical protein